MPLRNDLLNPIPGPNPSGENLRYAPVYDKIKEARREDDDVPQGEWAYERKMADWPLAIKLIGETLATKTKDLQLAAWLTEAMLRREGIAGLKESLDLIKGLLENFWDTIFPELEDGDAEFRATPLQWVGDRLEKAVKMTVLTRSGLDWFKYKESRAVGYEAAAEESDDKRQKRLEAIAEGKMSAEEFDAAFDATPKGWYEQKLAEFDTALASVAELSELCDGKFGDVSPSFSTLKKVLEEVRQSVYVLLQKKRETEPDVVKPAEAAHEEPAAAYDAPAQQAWAGAAAAPAPARIPAPRISAGPEPADREDAVARVISAARWLRANDPYSPAPYLMLRGLRWGELRAPGTLDPSLLAAPPSGIRQEIKSLALESNWTAVLEAAETAMGLECGRGWLDLQRYVCRAAVELGYAAIESAVKSELRALLADLPGLLQATLLDDTPTANGETQAFISEQVTAGAAGAAPAVYAGSAAMIEREPAAAGEELPPDAFELAMQAARSGRVQEGLEILTREMESERSGRARFQRKVQLAQLCLMTGHEAIAQPLLEQVAADIERRQLDGWEAGDVVAQPLALLYRCLAKTEDRAEQRRAIYARICRLDPVQALACSR